MGATENTFFNLARAQGLKLNRQVTLAGLTGRGHLEPTLMALASRQTLQQLDEIFHGLGGDETALASKRAVSLTVDFYAPDLDLYIEVDEIQHFTTDRRRTFQAYSSMTNQLSDLDDYVRTIEAWQSTADRYRAAKPAVDFPPPAGRRAQRAYFDSVRDLAAHDLGIQFARVPAPECDPALAFARFERFVSMKLPAIEMGRAAA